MAAKQEMAEQKAQEYEQKKGESVDASAYCANYGAHRAGMSKEEVAEYYSKWALDGGYEIDLGPERYHGPQIACRAVCECFPVNNKEKEHIKVLDIACGTGFLGEMLNQSGFCEVDGLDPADGMLKLAAKKNCYKKMLCEFMDVDVPIEKDTYDCSVIAGGMGEGHIPCSALHGMVHVVKPGGFVIIVMRKEYLQHVAEYKDRLEPLMQQLEDEGKWKMVSRTIVPRYSFDNDGVVFKFQVC